VPHTQLSDMKKEDERAKAKKTKEKLKKVLKKSTMEVKKGKDEVKGMVRRLTIK
jgi:hypothetical protein